MATVTILSTLNRVSALTPGCPIPVLEAAAREAMIELCQRTKAWRTSATAVNLVVGQANYVVPSPVTHGEVVDILDGRVTIAGVTTDLVLAPLQGLLRAHPDGAANGTPQNIGTALGAGVARVAPAPDTIGTLSCYVALRPTLDATVFDADLYSESREALVHGIVYRVLSMPQRSWSDAKNAVLEERKWTHRLAMMGWRSDTDFTKQALRVEPRPFA